MAESSISFTEGYSENGDRIVYEITVSPNSNICGLSFEIRYAEEQVTLNNCTLGEVLDGGIVKSNSSINGTVFFSYISVSPLVDSGSVITLNFTPISTGNKQIDITCTITECIDTNCDNISYTFAKGNIENPIYLKETIPDSTPPESNPANTEPPESTTTYDETSSETIAPETYPIQDVPLETEIDESSSDEILDNIPSESVLDNTADETDEPFNSSKLGTITLLCIGLVVSIIIIIVLVKLLKRRN